jgi:hypothetical protein
VGFVPVQCGPVNSNWWSTGRREGGEVRGEEGKRSEWTGRRRGLLTNCPHPSPLPLFPRHTACAGYMGTFRLAAAELYWHGGQFGAVAQLGEHDVCNVGVGGSIPLGSTGGGRQGLRNPFRVERAAFCRLPWVAAARQPRAILLNPFGMAAFTASFLRRALARRSRQLRPWLWACPTPYRGPPSSSRRPCPPPPCRRRRAGRRGSRSSPCR